MVDLVYYLTDLLFFDIPLLYYYTNLILSVVLCFSSGGIYLSLGIYISCLFFSVSKLYYYEVFETFIVLSAIL